MKERYRYSAMTRMSFEGILARDGVLIYPNVGDSMRPMIRQGRDLLVIRRLERKPVRNDIVLYKRDNGQYVLHRLIKIRKNDYVMRGDNRYGKEYGITDQHIIGILTSIIRNGEELPLSSWKYRLYVYVWCNLYPLRAVVLRVQSLIKCF